MFPYRKYNGAFRTVLWMPSLLKISNMQLTTRKLVNSLMLQGLPIFFSFQEKKIRKNKKLLRYVVPFHVLPLQSLSIQLYLNFSLIAMSKSHSQENWFFFVTQNKCYKRIKIQIQSVRKILKSASRLLIFSSSGYLV